MKKLLTIIIILFISFIGAKTIVAGRFNWQTVVQIKESVQTKTNEVVTQLNGKVQKVNDAVLSDEVKPSGEAPKPILEPAFPDHMLLDVPLLNQMDRPKLYNGCEVTSLAMILNYHGVNVTKNELAEKIKTVPFNYGNGKKGNPNDGFVGDMANGPGLGVYNGPVFELAQKYVGDKAINLTNSSFTDILKKVGQGLPVWIITTSNFTPVSVFQTWDTPQGKIDITFSEHSVAITGYDESYIYVNDPYGEKNKKVNRENFIKAWEQMGKQAIVIEK
ncbi:MULTISPECIES: C39 family peptidase [Bacillaceae]|uniref:C39 family peptidase n=1 Tax=Bacillaceae TaxID=186817 RepID=UPI00118C70BB|nr:C39 family peptidase [Bacillus sp. S3]QCJ41441.1 hydrolase [Bacillus sp. S3]